MLGLLVRKRSTGSRPRGESKKRTKKGEGDKDKIRVEKAIEVCSGIAVYGVIRKHAKRRNRIHEVEARG